MNIKELTPRMGNVELVAEVAEVREVREFNKFGKSGKVATARLKDDSGEIELPLWNEQIENVGKGDTIKVINGYVKEYQGELQLTTGMRGSIEVVKKAETRVADATMKQPGQEPAQSFKEKQGDFIDKYALGEEPIED